MSRTAAQALVDQLVIQGVRHIFCVPGESYLPVLDALIGRDIELTVCRQEGGAAIMAEAVGKQTGRPGICFVTRGPGATNAAHGVHIARQSSSPMILFVGQVDRSVTGRDAWQELDYAAVFGSMANGRPRSTTRRACPSGLASLPRRHEWPAGPGGAGAAARHAGRGDRALPCAAVARPAEAMGDVWTMAAGWRRCSAQAKRRSCCWAAAAGTRTARAAVTRFAERFELPVATGFRRLPLFDPLHPNYAGDLGLGPNPALLARVKAADLVLSIGDRLC